LKYPGISVVIAVLNEGEDISQCLDSIIRQTYKGEFEIIIADGGSDDNTNEIIKEYQIKLSNIVLLSNEKSNQAAGRNLAISKAKFDLIAYIDGHSFADEKWLECLMDTYLDKQNTNIFGVGSVYFNSDNSMFTKASDLVLRSLPAGANEEHFLNATTLKEVDNAYACLYRKEVFNQIGGYKEYLLTGEDLELNQRAVKAGYKLYVNPDSKVYYKRKSNLLDFSKQQFRYGYWRALLLKKKYFSFKPLVPALFLIFLVVGLLFSMFDKFFYEIYNYIILFYLVLVFYYSSKTGIQNKVSSFLCFLITVSLHLSYGAGMILGMLFNNKK
jgi:glycosyltransferase involved in cell wall biosynthesis